MEIAVPVQKFGRDQGAFIFKKLNAVLLAAWTEQNGYVLDGIIRGFAIASPADGSSSENYMTELQVPVRKA